MQFGGPVLVHKSWFDIGIETYNNIAMYNLIDTKYRQMAFRSLSDGAPISPNQPSFGTPGQTKVSGNHQRETTCEICCLAAELLTFGGIQNQ